MFFEVELFGSDELVVLIKLVLAAVAGGLVGLEREKHGRPAGLRTNLLVSVGACTMVIVSEVFYLKYGFLDADSAVRFDPARIAAQIVTGVGFLGAGVILKEGVSVRGLTTAASLWVVAGLGMAFGVGYFTLGMIATILVLVGLVFLKRLDPVIKKDQYLTLTITAVNRDALYDELQGVFDERSLILSDISSHVDLEKDELFIQMVLTQQQRRVGRELTAAIIQLEGIKKVHYH